jgi:hypothetical protein
MTNTFCIIACRDYQYAGVQGDDCYCANELGGDVSTSTFPDSCTLPCPGNPLEACGGLLPVAGRRRDMSPAISARQSGGIFGVVLSLFVDTAFAPAPPVNGNGTTIINGDVYNFGDTIINVDVFVYIELCDTCPFGFVTKTWTEEVSTVACGCPTEVLPTIECVTVTTVCTNCGPVPGTSTVTLTIPTGAITKTVNPPPVVPTSPPVNPPVVPVNPPVNPPVVPVNPPVNPPVVPVNPPVNPPAGTVTVPVVPGKTPSSPARPLEPS